MLGSTTESLPPVASSDRVAIRWRPDVQDHRVERRHVPYPRHEVEELLQSPALRIEPGLGNVLVDRGTRRRITLEVGISTGIVRNQARARQRSAQRVAKAAESSCSGRWISLQGESSAMEVVPWRQKIGALSPAECKIASTKRSRCISPVSVIGAPYRKNCALSALSAAPVAAGSPEAELARRRGSGRPAS